MKVRFLYIAVLAVLIVAARDNGYAMMCGSDAGGESHNEHASVKSPKDVCPVSGEAIGKDSSATYVYNGKSYKFCCPSCINKFKENPDKYIMAKADAHQHSH